MKVNACLAAAAALVAVAPPRATAYVTPEKVAFDPSVRGYIHGNWMYDSSGHHITWGGSPPLTTFDVVNSVIYGFITRFAETFPAAANDYEETLSVISAVPDTAEVYQLDLGAIRILAMDIIRPIADSESNNEISAVPSILHNRNYNRVAVTNWLNELTDSLYVSLQVELSILQSGFKNRGVMETAVVSAFQQKLRLAGALQDFLWEKSLDKPLQEEFRRSVRAHNDECIGWLDEVLKL